MTSPSVPRPAEPPTPALAVGVEHHRLATALATLRSGGPVVVVSDVGQTRGGLVMQAAEHATQASLTLMARHAGGIVCVALPAERADALGLRLSRDTREGDGRIPYTVTVEAARGVTTGISAADRAVTARVLADPEARSRDLVQPGHVVPVRVADDTQGWPRVALDLARLAEVTPAVAVCHILDEDGAVAGETAVHRFAAEHSLPMLDGRDVADGARRRTAALMREQPSSLTHDGRKLKVYTFRDGPHRHFAVVHGDPVASTPLVRAHVQRPLLDALGDDRAALVASLDQIVSMDAGVLLYLADQGRGDESTLWLLPYAVREILADLGVKAFYDRPPGTPAVPA